MMKLSVREILGVTGGEISNSDETGLCEGFSTDSRTVRKGEFFIAIKGDKFDGHDFILQAVSRGARGVIAGYRAAGVEKAKVGNYIVVPDPLQAMGKLASYLRKKASIPVICVTGTNGKTSVKELTSQLLSLKYKVLKSQKSFNNIIGLSLTLFSLEKEHEIAVLEIGTNHPGEILSLGEIASPDTAVITNVGNGHLEFFGDRRGVFREKVSILKTLSAKGSAFLNGDDELLAAVPKKEKLKFFGTSLLCDLRVSEIVQEGTGHAFSLNGMRFYVPFEGEHNVYNAAAAVSVALHYGVDPEKIKMKLCEISLPGMRLEKVVLGGVTFLNDSYNANPDSFESALRVLNGTETAGKKWVVAGDMLELGERSSALHGNVGKSIAGKKIDFLVTVGDLSARIAEGAVTGGMDKKNVYIAPDHESAARILKKTACPRDIVLVKGSRGSRMEEVIKCFTTCCSS